LEVFVPAPHNSKQSIPYSISSSSWGCCNALPYDITTNFDELSSQNLTTFSKACLTLDKAFLHNFMVTSHKIGLALLFLDHYNLSV